jgi:hypothetical protein
VLLGLLAFARPPVEPTEAEVAVGHKRPHLELGGQRHRGTVMCRGRRRVGADMMRGDLAQETEGPRLIAAFTASTSEAHGAVGAGAGVLDLVGEQIRLAELSDTERVVIPNPGAFIVGQRPLQAGDASSMRPDHAYTCPKEAIAMAAHIGRHPSESSRIVKRSGQPFGFLEIPPDGCELVQREERLAKVETKIYRTLDLLVRLRQRVQGRQCLLEPVHRLPVGRVGEGLGAGLPEVRNRLLPQLAPEGMVSQAFDLPAQPIRVERLERLHNPRMEYAPTVVEHAPVGHLVSEGVLERVLEIREDARLVEELGGLEVGEPTAKAFLGHVGDGLQECEGHILPDDGGSLKQRLVLGWQSVDTCGKDRQRTFSARCFGV